MVATVAALRTVLAQHFGEQRARTCLLRQREAGELPEGNAGRNGSAPVTVHQAVFALLIMALDDAGDALEAVAEAQRIGAFRLLRRDETHLAGPEKRTPFENQTLTLLDAIANELERIDEDHGPSSWRITAHGAYQIAPDTLLFGESLESVVDPAECVVRSCRIPSRLLADIAALFHSARAEAA